MLTTDPPRTPQPAGNRMPENTMALFPSSSRFNGRDEQADQSNVMCKSLQLGTLPRRTFLAQPGVGVGGQRKASRRKPHQSWARVNVSSQEKIGMSFKAKGAGLDRIGIFGFHICCILPSGQDRGEGGRGN